MHAHLTSFQFYHSQGDTIHIDNQVWSLRKAIRRAAVDGYFFCYIELVLIRMLPVYQIHSNLFSTYIGRYIRTITEQGIHLLVLLLHVLRCTVCLLFQYGNGTLRLIPRPLFRTHQVIEEKFSFYVTITSTILIVAEIFVL